MYFNKIRLSGLHDIDLHIYDATPQDRYLLKGADGLDPPGVDLYFAKIAAEGSVFQNRRPQDRELVFRVGLNPAAAANERHSDLRDELYGLLSTADASEEIFVQFMNGELVVAQTNGWVKALEAVIFTKDPEVQITIGSPSPYFKAPSTTELVTPAGQVPVTTPSSYNPVINNPGSASTGFVFEVVFDYDTAAFNILGNVEQTKVLMSVGLSSGTTFLAGDTLIIDTRIGSRKVDRLRAGTTVSMLKYLTPGSM